MAQRNLRTATGSELNPLAFAHPTPFEASKIRPVANTISHVKPHGGIWLSPFLGESMSVWTCWLDDEYGPSTLYGDKQLSVQKMVLDPRAELLLIDERADLDAILEHYTAPNEMEFPGVPDELLAHLKAPTIDFEAVSKDYDGIYLTDNGQWDTRYGPGGNYTMSGPNLYGWDLECALLFSSESIIYAADPVPHVYIPQEEDEERFEDILL